jgi:hypothetical protein
MSPCTPRTATIIKNKDLKKKFNGENFESSDDYKKK